MKCKNKKPAKVCLECLQTPMSSLTIRVKNWIKKNCKIAWLRTLDRVNGTKEKFSAEFYDANANFFMPTCYKLGYLTTFAAY